LLINILAVSFCWAHDHQELNGHLPLWKKVSKAHSHLDRCKALAVPLDNQSRKSEKRSWMDFYFAGLKAFRKLASDESFFQGRKSKFSLPKRAIHPRFILKKAQFNLSNSIVSTRCHLSTHIHAGFILHLDSFAMKSS
jgi:hypothetical protein